MDEPITATDANRYFSALIRDVQEGKSYIVTSHGRPVARIVPVNERDPLSAEEARKRLFERTARKPVVDVGA